MKLGEIFLHLLGGQSGRNCRSCHEPIPGGDSFGLSEAVCGPCRHA